MSRLEFFFSFFDCDGIISTSNGFPYSLSMHIFFKTMKTFSENHVSSFRLLNDGAKFKILFRK